MDVSGGLHVVEHHAGAAGIPAVVLVHGSLDRASSFGRVVRRLQDLRVVTYDRRGYRGSRRMRPLGVLVDHVKDLVELVGRGPAVVIGHSYGGDVAIGAALAAPGAVVGLGAWEPPLAWLEWWPRRARQPGDEDSARFAEHFFRRMVGDSAWERAGERVRQRVEADGPALMAELVALRSSGEPFDIGALSVPAVFGRGGDSRPHHRRAVEELVGMVPGSALFEVPHAAHGVHLTHPAAFADFVRAVVGAAPSAQEREQRI
jgi:pimeloyl-ACP methyl ester carboxylesterase